MNPLFLESVGLYAPGLEGWENSSSILAGVEQYAYQPIAKYKPQLLPPNERRRATGLVRIAFGAAEDAIAGREEEASQLAAVFASSGGDYQVVDHICRALSLPEKAVSPTHFHNSVHNAAAGYWSIASASMASSMSLSAHDFSVAAGLLEAAMLVGVEHHPTLLITCDPLISGPLASCRPVTEAFASALWLSHEPSKSSIHKIELELVDGIEATPAASPELERLRLANPAARILPLLETIARGQGVVHIALSGPQGLAVSVSRC